ncbi:MAG: hypothetical protein HY727_01150 [Candidatus Rokubacteria bacterium]|nr:hypothetical protein [Candidatus Rokubacteria bacterium]
MTDDQYRQLIDFLGPRFEAIDQRFETIDQRFATIDQRVEGLATDLASLRREILAHFDELYRRLERLEAENQMITQGLRRIEALLGDEQQRREILERGLESLKRDVIALQARIEHLEQRLRG